ncbi:hypothetical protein KHQ81_13080 [Mycoplasmatota bacterium]|nr:hypothetical protein KHQ81_13080 [Mycoplasmatota bacterium]
MLVEYTKDVESNVFSVIKENNKFICQRCGNIDQEGFFKDQLGVYCRKCLIFGKSSSYRKICRKQVINEFNDIICLNKVIYLSEIQKLASKRCLDAYKYKKDLLIYAVCGAGNENLNIPYNFNFVIIYVYLVN